MNNIKNQLAHVAQSVLNTIKSGFNSAAQVLSRAIIWVTGAPPRAKDTKHSPSLTSTTINQRVVHEPVVFDKDKATAEFLADLPPNQSAAFKKSAEFKAYQANQNPFDSIDSAYQNYDKLVTDKQQKVTYFLSTLDPDKSKAFSDSPEFNEYQEGLLYNYNNPSYLIDEPYQKYTARSFLENLDHPLKDAFSQSNEYKSCLEPTSIPLNPFDDPVTIETTFDNYCTSVKKALKERKTQLDLDIHDFFYLDETNQEYPIKQAFLTSDAYTDLTKEIKKQMENFALSLTIVDVENACNTFKKKILEENTAFLDNLGNDKDDFMQSSEYKLATEKPFPLPKDFQEAHGKYTKRLQQELAFKTFTDPLKKTRRFDNFSKSQEYTNATKDPDFTIDQLKSALISFEKRSFMENLDDPLREDFEASEAYSSLPPLSSVDDLEAALANFKKQEIEKYLKDLKDDIGDAAYEAFTSSNEYQGTLHSTSTELTREDVEDAYNAFKTRTTSWFRGWW